MLRLIRSGLQRVSFPSSSAIRTCTTSTSEPKKRAVVYGGAGTLGNAIVGAFRRSGWWVASVDFRQNPDASASITLNPSTNEIESSTDLLEQAAEKEPISAFVHAAGGWAGGDATSSDIMEAADRLWRMNTLSAIGAAHMATRLLAPNGLLVMTGANSALTPTPNMLAYGVTKAAVHHLVSSLSASGSGLPSGATVLGVLPVTIDTPNNRVAMPTASFEDWTPPADIAQKIIAWAQGQEKRPRSGALVSVITQARKTTFKNHALYVSSSGV